MQSAHARKCAVFAAGYMRSGLNLGCSSSSKCQEKSLWVWRCCTSCACTSRRYSSQHRVSNLLTCRYNSSLMGPYSNQQSQFEDLARFKILGCKIHRGQHKLVEYRSSNDGVPPPPSVPPPAAVPSKPSNPSQPPKPSKRKPTKEVSNFIFSKFFTFVQNYQNMMERKFPKAMQIYRVFIEGVKEFSKELAEYVKIKTKALISANSIFKLSRQELDVYFRMPNEIFRVGPTLLLSALPGFQYIIFPIALKFPKHLLSSHFWTLQEKSQFAIDAQKKRLLNQRPVLRHLQSNVDSIRDRRQQDLCKEILFKLGSGSQPTVPEIMRIKPLFESDPFSMKSMHGPHIKSLCRLHGVKTWIFNRGRLFDRAEMLFIMDMCLMRDGVFNLKTEELKSACFLRGLNAANTSHDDMVEFIQQWLSISSTIQPHSYSLLLHLPVLLAYNNPNNWALLT
ncbi:LETM1 domain-containing protein 1 [Orchesella cincta]|uniref:LETM1 domain-containing protein 1 n=1 Tax=Orchesella cincta TaxID=48709 RepID=A0A1D2NKF7_ORCCI|nr:LETM1 domain-containing protein 1 [Orchesella cincta]